jgi:uncharacterized delta-60 repeat protein
MNTGYSNEQVRQVADLLDPTFGDDGVVLSTFNQMGYIDATAIAISSNDNIYLAGHAGRKPSGENDTVGRVQYWITRLTPTGHIDKTFGDQGMVSGYFNEDFYSVYTNGLGIQKNGDLLLFTYDSTQGKVALARFKEDGKLDVSFGDDGKRVLDIGPASQPESVLQDRFPGRANQSGSCRTIPLDDGKIVVFGNCKPAPDKPDVGVIYRLNADGSIDLTFGDKGHITIERSFPTSLDQLLVQPDGKYLGFGSADWEGPNAKAMFVRYETSGSLDTSFGDNGFQLVDIENGVRGTQLILQKEGRSVGIGHTRSSSGLLIGLSADGTLDTDFNGGNPVYTKLNDDMTWWNGGATHNDDKIGVVGVATHPENKNLTLTVARYAPNGNLDENFNGKGWVQPLTQSQYSYANAVAVQRDGKLLVAGHSDNEVCILRLKN